MSAAWPPPPTTEHPWHDRRLRVRELDHGHAVVRVRSVPLWGQIVLLNEDEDAVYCPDCWTFVELAKLSTPDNHHRVGLRRRSGAVFRYEDDEPDRRPSTIRDMGF